MDACEKMRYKYLLIDSPVRDVTSHKEAAPGVQQLHQHAREAGRSADDLFLAVAPGEKMPQVTLDALKQYRDAGVKQLILRLPTASPDRIDAALEAMADNLIVPAQSL